MTSTAAAPHGSRAPGVAANRYLTLPNAFTLLRLGMIPLYWYLLFGRDSVVAAAWLLGALGATDWVDGWLARRFDQVSEFGKKFDPTADRLLFIVAIAGIIAAEAAPLWIAWAIVVREVAVGGTVAVATLAFGMERFDVSWWGKTATFLLMFALPGFMLGGSDAPAAELFGIAAWVLGIPGVVLSYATAVAYMPMIRAAVRSGRRQRRTRAAQPVDGPVDGLIDGPVDGPVDGSASANSATSTTTVYGTSTREGSG